VTKRNRLGERTAPSGPFVLDPVVGAVAGQYVAAAKPQRSSGIASDASWAALHSGVFPRGAESVSFGLWSAAVFVWLAFLVGVARSCARRLWVERPSFAVVDPGHEAGSNHHHVSTESPRSWSGGVLVLPGSVPRPASPKRRRLVPLTIPISTSSDLLGLLQGVASSSRSRASATADPAQAAGWNIHQNDSTFTFLVATLWRPPLVLLGFFWRRLGFQIVPRAWEEPTHREIVPDRHRREAGVAGRQGTIPAGSRTFAEHKLRSVSPPPVGCLFSCDQRPAALRAEALRRRAPQPNMATRTTGSHGGSAGATQPEWNAPGFGAHPGSRVRAITMGGGLLVGLWKNEDAARSPSCSRRRSSAPLPPSAPELFGSQESGCAGCSGGRALRRLNAYCPFVLMRFFERIVDPFAAYCLAAGLACTFTFSSSRGAKSNVQIRLD